MRARDAERVLDAERETSTRRAGQQIEEARRLEMPRGLEDPCRMCARCTGGWSASLKSVSRTVSNLADSSRGGFATTRRRNRHSRRIHEVPRNFRKRHFRKKKSQPRVLDRDEDPRRSKKDVTPCRFGNSSSRLSGGGRQFGCFTRGRWTEEEKGKEKRP